MAKPKIRFKGYTNDWEQRKLGELYKKSSEKNDGSISMDRNITVATMQFKEDVKVSTEDYLKTYYTFNIGDIAFEGHQSKEYRFGRFVENDIGNGIVSHIFAVFRPIVDYDLQFWKYAINNESLMQRVLSRSTKASTMMHDLVTDDFLEQKFLVPSVKEQERIGMFLSNLDNLITLHQRKCDQAKKLKKYMLQKMFPKNNESVPEIRFEGFSNDWEQRKFGEITELKSASRVHKDEWTSNGVPFYRSSDVMAAINGTENEKAFISEELYEKLSKVSGKLEEGDILVTGGGSVGNPYIVPDNKPLYTKDADLLWIKNKGKFHPYFFYEFFFSPTFRNYLGSISHVGTIAHYTITQLSDTPICLPSFEEQKKVGEYFQSLDNLITLHQWKFYFTKSPHLLRQKLNFAA